MKHHFIHLFHYPSVHSSGHPSVSSWSVYSDEEKKEWNTDIFINETGSLNKKGCGQVLMAFLQLHSLSDSFATIRRRNNSPDNASNADKKGCDEKSLHL